jgi:hypothetical protein
MDVGALVLGVARRPDGRDRVSLGEARALPDLQRPEMRQRRLVPVARRDRDGEPVRRYLPGEGHLAGNRGPHHPGGTGGDVDPAVLAGGVLVVDDGERAQDPTLRRPRPGESRRSLGQRAGERHEREQEPSGCPSCEHAATVASVGAAGNAV